MDVRSSDIDPITEHESVIVHSLVPKFSMLAETKGGYLEFVDFFTVEAGLRPEPHFHNTHEFYFIIEGESVMQIEDEVRRVGPGDLVHIPPNARHTARTITRSKALSFSISYQEPFSPGYHPCELEEIVMEPHE